MQEWEANLSIGVKAIDEQHKSLFDVLSKLISALFAENINKSVIESMSFLEDYIMRHFADEEDLMREIKYPGIDLQEIEHKRFILEYVRKKEVIMRKEEVTESFAMELQSWIGNWLRRHILSEDKKIAEFIEKNHITIPKRFRIDED
ncbi:MAG: hemerythrin family protein [Bacteroidales bacterium]|jgi:hemerythrin|nr:hemerythrin family protein [Bacteroidales bacterium]